MTGDDFPGDGELDLDPTNLDWAALEAEADRVVDWGEDQNLVGFAAAVLRHPEAVQVPVVGEGWPAGTELEVQLDAETGHVLLLSDPAPPDGTLVVLQPRSGSRVRLAHVEGGLAHFGAVPVGSTVTVAVREQAMLILSRALNPAAAGDEQGWELADETQVRRSSDGSNIVVTFVAPSPGMVWLVGDLALPMSTRESMSSLHAHFRELLASNPPVRTDAEKVDPEILRRSAAAAADAAGALAWRAIAQSPNLSKSRRQAILSGLDSPDPS